MEADKNQYWGYVVLHILTEKTSKDNFSFEVLFYYVITVYRPKKKKNKAWRGRSVSPKTRFDYENYNLYYDKTMFCST